MGMQMSTGYISQDAGSTSQDDEVQTALPEQACVQQQQQLLQQVQTPAQLNDLPQPPAPLAYQNQGMQQIQQMEAQLPADDLSQSQAQMPLDRSQLDGSRSDRSHLRNKRVEQPQVAPQMQRRYSLPQTPNPFGMSGQAAPMDFKDDDEVEAAVATLPAQAEPEPDTTSTGPLSVSTRIEYSALPSGQTQDVFGLVTVQAEAAPEPVGAEGRAERPPMDVVCVLDVSGSMNGDKIRQVQDATRFIVEQADPKDRLSIVTFNSMANRALRLRKMSAEGKNEATVATLRLRAGGGTSIAAGLDMALEIMEQRRQRNKVSAILLLTDGQDGSTRRRIPELLRRAAQANCALYAFGFGADHDAALLSEIAEQAHTPFTFVEETGKIREAFAGTVGGLTSIVAQRVELTFKLKVPMKAAHTSFSLQRTSDLEAVVTIPDMFANERRDILVELAVPADSNAAGQMVLLEASARYIDLHRECFVQTPVAVMEAQRTEEPQPEAEPDEEVSAQRERVEVTRALEEAAVASDRGRFEDALQKIDDAEERMKSTKRKTSISEALGQELADARNRMRSRSSWEQGGRAEIRDAALMHKMQRCTNLMSSELAPMKSSKAMYCNSMQTAMIKRSQGNSTSRSSGWW